MNPTTNNYVMEMFASPNIPLNVISTSGTQITTKEYGELIDFQSGCWAALLGHNKSEIVQVIKDNIAILLHTHQFFDTEHPGKLVKELINAANLQASYKGSFLSSGSEAVSLSVALADLITKRNKKLCFSISYLGANSDLRLPRNPDYWLDLNIKACLSCKENVNCSNCDKLANINFSEISSFVFEPGNSGGLVLCPPDKLINFLAKETKKSGGLVIVNEVTTGFGRTGKWFGFQHYSYLNTTDTSPDIIAMGKGLGNGYPISGILVKAQIAEMIEESNYRYVQSHSNDPLGCIIARKVIEIMVKDNLVEKGNEAGNYLRSKLAQIDGIQEIRGRGMMNIAVLDESFKAKEVFKALLEKGFFVGYIEFYNSLHLYAPLVLTKDEVDKLCESLIGILGNKI